MTVFKNTAFELFVGITIPTKNRPCGRFCESWLRGMDLNH